LPTGAAEVERGPGSTILPTGAAEVERGPGSTILQAITATKRTIMPETASLPRSLMGIPSPYLSGNFFFKKISEDMPEDFGKF
jgi:hypothetical protein